MLSAKIPEAQHPPQNADSLLNKAKNLYGHDPQMGISLAKAAYAAYLKAGMKLDAIKSLKLITYYYYGIEDFNNARYFSSLGLKSATKNEIDSLTGDFLSITGSIDQVENNYGSAISNYKEAIAYYNKLGLTKRIGNTYINIGVCNRRLSHFETANFYYFKSADIFLKLNDTSDLADTYNSMGLSFLSLKNYSKSLEYHKKALVLRTTINNKPLVAQSLNNIGLLFKEIHQPDSSILYLSKSIAIYQKERDSSLLVLPLQNIGSSWKMKGDLKKAQSYVNRSLKIAANYGMKEDLARGELDLAEIDIAQKKYAAAQAAIDITKNTAQTLKLPELLMNAYADEFTLYTQKGDYKNALFYENKKTIIKDSLFTLANNKAINELEIKYNTSQKEKDIAALHLQNALEKKVVGQQKVSIIALAVGAVLLCLLLIITYNNFRIKNKANLRIQTLMQDLHHRVKNNLQVLSGLFTMQIESLGDESAKNALRENEARLNAMNLIHSKLYLDHSTTQIEMNEYLTNLIHHIKDAFGADHKTNISLRLAVEPIMLDADKAVAIGLIINELTINCFKYAFEKSGEIYLGLSLEGKSRLILQLNDNGKGIPAVSKEGKPSFGLKLVNLMSRQLGATMVTENNNGTAYRFDINI